MWKVSLNAYQSSLRTAGIPVESILQDLKPPLTPEELACIEKKEK